MCGIGVIVIITQINAFVGLEVRKDIHDVISNINDTIQNINIQALYVSIPSLFILFFWPQIGKKIEILSKIPAPLITLIVGSMMAYTLNLNIPYIGDKMDNSSAVNVFTLYVPDLNRTIEFIGPAFALAALAVLDSLLSCKVADNMTGIRHSSDRETFGQGMANMAAGILGGVTTATATMRTVANIKFGGKTPLASIVHGLVLFAILSGLGNVVAKIPNACLAAILFKVGIDIMDYRIIPVLKKIPMLDLIVFLVVLFVTVYEDLMIAITIGIVIALIGNLNQINHAFKSSKKHELSPISESKIFLGNEDFPSLSKLPINVLKPHGPIFFGSVEHILKAYSYADKHHTLIIDMRSVKMVDLTGIYALEDLITLLQKKNIEVYMTQIDSKIENVFEDTGFFETIEKNYISNDLNEIFNAIDSRKV